MFFLLVNLHIDMGLEAVLPGPQNALYVMLCYVCVMAIVMANKPPPVLPPPPHPYVSVLCYAGNRLAQKWAEYAIMLRCIWIASY